MNSVWNSKNRTLIILTLQQVSLQLRKWLFHKLFSVVELHNKFPQILHNVEFQPRP